MKTVSILFVFLGLTLGLSSAIAFADNPSGIIVEAEGQAEIKNSSGVVVASTSMKTVRPIKKDAPFYEGETIVTGNNGKLKLQFAEGKNEVLLGPNTTLVIQKAPFDLRMKRGTKLFLDSGYLDSVIKQKYSGSDGDEFAVETKTLVAGVRGTEFVVAHDKVNNLSSVNVKSGIVEVTSIADQKIRVRLKAGEKIDSAKWKTDKQDVAKPAAQLQQQIR